MKKTKKFFIALAAIFAATVSLTSCDNKDNKHDYSSLWSYDAESHWHDAVCEHIEQGDKESHSWTEVTTTSGTKTVCSVCGKEKKENATYEVDASAFTNAVNSIDNFTYNSVSIADDKTSRTTIYNVSNDRMKYETDATTQLWVNQNGSYMVYTLAEDKTSWNTSSQPVNTILISTTYALSSSFSNYSNFTFNSDNKSYTCETTETYGGMDIYAYYSFHFEDGKLLNAYIKTKTTQDEKTSIVTVQLTNIGTTEDFDTPSN